MSYIDPQTVTSPKHSWELGTVLHNTGDEGWSLAKGKWDGKEAFGIRWNGSSDDSGIGNPQSRGIPTWFILPDEISKVVISALSLATPHSG